MNNEPFLKDQLGFPPEKDQIEVTVFGPGYGESILIHIPSLGWGIVDSCCYTFKDINYVLPLEYLRIFNVKKLCFAIISHPHADHYKGMLNILQEFKTNIEKICLYSGNGTRELKQYLSEKEGLLGDRQRDIRELGTLFKYINVLKEKGVKLFKLSEMTNIVPDSEIQLDNHRKFRVNIIALSPSGASVDKYENILKTIISKVLQNRDIDLLVNFDDRNHNLISSAILLQIGNANIILGSDLEIGDSEQEGWRGVCSLWTTLSAHLLKVSHHGSENAHYDDAWRAHSSLSQPTSIVTSFNKTPKLPTENDISRIKRNSIKLGITSVTQLQRADQFYSREVSRLMRSNMRKNWPISWGEGRPGFARIRFDLQARIIEEKAIPPAQWVS